ncbi:conserved hypothetical protein [Yersinia pestis KIM D27]|uniref:Uncharacterized protein n=1 Tax=Yersinia pestis biovar Orientalis str. IP275 TaxID=373665 RepID=A0AAV3BCN3_YERPE|nr:hypothetical protein YpAngola_A0441 [Yersinia pestis Angola]EDR30399.1 hypothetical protein YPIP275_0385 [Yersinia pestis biovar Orientalis str. IP275]EDR44970.1 hypothetical protein YpE1979001_1481 [Yersinia pestis biovar Antiqua str. E1979001]EFA49125.1 conserved hypothetical protein [Yersinia pestis KIM D27]
MNHRYLSDLSIAKEIHSVYRASSFLHRLTTYITVIAEYPRVE